MPKFTTIIFDMDGVVIDSENYYHKADTAFLGKYGAPYNQKTIAPKLIGLTLKEGTGILKDMFNLPAGLEELFLERQALFAGVCQQYVEYMSGFLDFFVAIKSKGFKTCIATAADDYVVKTLDEKLKLHRLFGKNIFSSSQVGYKSKPDPAIFLYAAEQMGSQPQDCFVIEDAPRGIEAAKRAGMFCIGLIGTFEGQDLAQADIIADSFPEIKQSLLS